MVSICIQGSKLIRHQKSFEDVHLREDAAKLLQFCGTENFGFQFYDLIWFIIVNLSMLAINRGPVCQIGG